MQLLVSAIGLLVAVFLDLDGWNGAAIAFPAGVVAAIVLQLWLIGHYEAEEAQERRQVALLPDDAPIGSLRRRLLLSWLLLYLPLGAGLLALDGPTALALSTGIGMGGLIGAAIQRRRDISRGWGLYVEPRWIRRSDKPYWFVGRRG